MILLASVTYPKELFAYDSAGAQDERDELVDKMIDKLVNKHMHALAHDSTAEQDLKGKLTDRMINTLVSKLFSWSLKASTSVHSAIYREPRQRPQLRKASPGRPSLRHVSVRGTDETKTLEGLDSIFTPAQDAQVKDAQVKDENLQNTLQGLDDILGTTTKEPAIQIQRNFSSSAPAPLKPKPTEAPAPEFNLNRDLRQAIAAGTFYLQLLLLIRFIVDILPVKGTDWEAPLNLFLEIVDIYLAAFKVFGPFDFVVGWFSLSLIRSLLQDELPPPQ